MKYGSTTSIRLPPQLKKQLEEASTILHRGKNWIIKEAIEEYLIKHKQILLEEEAHRQSILASQSDKDSTWDEETDTTGWI